MGLAGALGWPWVDGDDLHPRANVEKMSRGQPLDDTDRAPWLQIVRSTGIQMLKEGRRGGLGGTAEVGAGGDGEKIGGEGAAGVVLACSALKKSYREILRGKLGEQEETPDANPEDGRIETYFVWIKGERATMLERIEQRQGHFMKAVMLDSQLATLEVPTDDEDDVLSVPLDLSRTDQLGVALDGLRLLIDRCSHP